MKNPIEQTPSTMKVEADQNKLGIMSDLSVPIYKAMFCEDGTSYTYVKADLDDEEKANKVTP